jgi:hypothetical protein
MKRSGIKIAANSPAEGNAPNLTLPYPQILKQVQDDLAHLILVIFIIFSA